MKYVHGTSYESAMDILKNGLSSDKTTVWTCSDKSKIYCRKDEDDESEWLSIESAQIAAAFNGSMSTKVGIIKIKPPIVGIPFLRL